MEQPPAATRPKPIAPTLRQLVWWTIWFCLAGALLIRLPYEVSYWMLALAEKASLEGRTEEALAWVDRAKLFTPESLLPRKVAARAMQRAGKLDEIGRIDLVLEDKKLRPEDKAALHLEKSELLQQKGRWDDALAELDKAAAFQGDLRPSGRRFGLLMLAGRVDDAAREIEQLLKQNTSDAQKVRLHYELSTIYRGQGRYEEALSEFDKATELEPKLRTTPEQLELLLLNDKLEEAKQQLPEIEKYLSSNWQSTAVIDNSVAYFQAVIGDDLEAALERIERALKADADNEAYLDTQAFILHRLGRNEDALQAAERAVESVERTYADRGQKVEDRKNVAVIVYHRSLIYDALGKSVEALQDRERVRELGFEPDERLF